MISLKNVDKFNVKYIYIFLHIILIPWLLTSCQVQETTSDGSLISSHQPTTNSFTINSIISKIYVEDEIINISLSFPFDLIVNTQGGEPILQLTVGSNSRQANYTTGSDPRKLYFQYRVIAGDEDSDGITINGLSLNGSTLTFDNHGTNTDCDITSITSKTFPSAKIDTTQPQVSNITFLTLNPIVRLGNKVYFNLKFSEKVYVTGTPNLIVNFDSGNSDIPYFSGSGTDTLLFSLPITSNMYDINGFNYPTTINLNSGYIKDAAGNLTILDLSNSAQDAILSPQDTRIHGSAPYIDNFNLPDNGTYLNGQHLDFEFIFNEPVDVSGSPYLALTVGSDTKMANYLSGSGTNTLIFRYTPTTGDIDSDGIEIQNNITQNSGNIISRGSSVSYFSFSENNTFSEVQTDNIKVSAPEAAILSVTKNLDITFPSWGSTSTADNYWIIGQELDISVLFNAPIFVNQSGGVPSLSLTIGSSTKQASYVSGGDGQTTLIFRYTIQEGDEDSDGSLSLGNLSLNGATIVDNFGSNAVLTLPTTELTSIYVDGIRPFISSVTAPSNGTYSASSSNTLLASSMIFDITWNENIKLTTTNSSATKISLIFGAQSGFAYYVSGNQTNTLELKPTSISGFNDSNGIEIESPLITQATILDQRGNACIDKSFIPPDTSEILVDTISPTISSISVVTADGTYKTDDLIEYDVTFSESLSISVLNGYPRIPLIIGDDTVYLVPSSDGVAQTHRFRYAITNNIEEVNSISIAANSFQDNSSSPLKDAGLNALIKTHTAISSPGIIIDNTLPTIDGALTLPSNGTYSAGTTLSITVPYSKVVEVTGTPKISVTADSGTLDFIYTSGSGSTDLTFSFTISSSNFDFTGLSSFSSISLGGGTIKDLAGNNAVTDLGSQDLSGIKIVYPNTNLWVQYQFQSLAPNSAPAISNVGIITSETCGNNNYLCRTFNGDDNLSLDSTLSSVKTVFLIIRLPSNATANSSFDIFSTYLTLDPDAARSNFDLISESASITVGGDSNSYSGTTHDVNLPEGNLTILQIDFTSPIDVDTGNIFDASFSGAIGEVMVLTGTPTETQKTDILNYLVNKY